MAPREPTGPVEVAAGILITRCNTVTQAAARHTSVREMRALERPVTGESRCPRSRQDVQNVRLKRDHRDRRTCRLPVMVRGTLRPSPEASAKVCGNGVAKSTFTTASFMIYLPNWYCACLRCDGDRGLHLLRCAGWRQQTVSYRGWRAKYDASLLHGSVQSRPP